MTIITAVIAKPKGKRKPFAVIASDTKMLNLVDGVLIESDTAKKVLPFGNMYIGLAGVTPSHIFDDLSEVISEYYISFDDACEWLCEELTKYLNEYNPSEVNSLSGYLRLTMILISIENNSPKFAEFEYDTRYESTLRCLRKIECGDYGTSYVCYIGNTSKTINEQYSFKKEIQSFGEKINILNAKQSMRKFMSATSEVYPDRCNKIFESYQIEGE